MKTKFLLCLIQILFMFACLAQSNNTTLWTVSPLVEHNYIDSPIILTYTVYDNMPDTLSNISISYTINGGVPVRAKFYLFLTGHTGYNTAYLSHPVPLLIHTPGIYRIHATIDSVDGVASTYPILDSFNIDMRFYPVSPLLHKKVLIEEFTGAWCGHCSGGTYNLENIIKSDTDYMAVAVHIASSTGNDQMQIPQGVAIYDTYSGTPTAMINRGVYRGVHGRNWTMSPISVAAVADTLALLSKRLASPANVRLTNLTYDSISRVMSVDVNADFLATLTTGDFRINLTLTEDSVVRPLTDTVGYGWDQDNYYYTHLTSTRDDSIPELYSLPIFIINKAQPGGWVHNHVLRYMLGGPWGDSSVISHTPQAGTTYTKHYTYTLPVTWDPHQVSLLGMVQQFHPHNNNRQPADWTAPDLILNSTKKLLIAHTIINTNIAEPHTDIKARFYPNPSRGTIEIELSKATVNSSVAIYDLRGMLVGQQALHTGINSCSLSLPSGIYQIHILQEGSEQIEKLVIVR